jgi:hypothetical protein
MARPITITADEAACKDVPLSIVLLNRWILVLGVLGGLAAGQPLVTTLLFTLLLPAVLFGQRGSPIAWLGRRLFASRIPNDAREDRRLMRFNNMIALVLLGGAQIAFALNLPVLGWALALAVAAAASVALAGFCLGCFLYYQFKLHQRRLFS